MCRLMTTQLAEALEGYPLYSQDGKGKEAVCRAVFALGSVRWFILEGNREDDDVILFGTGTSKFKCYASKKNGYQTIF